MQFLNRQRRDYFISKSWRLRSYTTVHNLHHFAKCPPPDHRLVCVEVFLFIFQMSPEVFFGLQHTVFDERLYSSNSVCCSLFYLSFFYLSISRQPERVRKRRHGWKAENLCFPTVPVSLFNSFWLPRYRQVEKRLQRVRKRDGHGWKAENLCFPTVPVSLSNSFWLPRYRQIEKRLQHTLLDEWLYLMIQES